MAPLRKLAGVFLLLGLCMGIVAGNDERLSVLNAACGDQPNSTSGWRLQKELEAPLGLVSAVQFSPDGKTLAAVTEKGTVYLWDVPDSLSGKSSNDTR